VVETQAQHRAVCSAPEAVASRTLLADASLAIKGKAKVQSSDFRTGKDEKSQPATGTKDSKRTDCECSICFEKVLEQGNIFGILESCLHSFCLRCIRNWRRPKDEPDTTPGASNLSPLTLRSCPICRQLSLYVVPSHTFPANLADKKKILDNYKASRSRIDCKHFVRSGQRRCPFGDEVSFLVVAHFSLILG
jgi:hypothetical protein